MEKLYDVMILGAGPAGLSAALYAGRSRLSVLVLEKGSEGGQITVTDEIENYPGQLVEGESGASLAERMAKQAEKFGAERIKDRVLEVDLDGEIKTLKGEKGVYKAKSVIIASGAHFRPIGCENEMEYVGRGISYCATCDALFFEGLEVYVAGGGDSAVKEALYLTKFAKKVTIIHRRNELRAAKSLQEKAFQNEKIAFIWNAVIEEVFGEGILQGMILRDTKTGEKMRIEAEPADGMFGLFGFVGTIPNTELFQGTELQMDEAGYIITGEDMTTNIPGVFAAGDVRAKKLRQVITAASDGAVAAVEAEHYLA